MNNKNINILTLSLFAERFLAHEFISTFSSVPPSELIGRIDQPHHAVAACANIALLRPLKRVFFTPISQVIFLLHCYTRMVVALQQLFVVLLVHIPHHAREASQPADACDHVVPAVDGFAFGNAFFPRFYNRFVGHVAHPAVAREVARELRALAFQALLRHGVVVLVRVVAAALYVHGAVHGYVVEHFALAVFAVHLFALDVVEVVVAVSVLAEAHRRGADRLALQALGIHEKNVQVVGSCACDLLFVGLEFGVGHHFSAVVVAHDCVVVQVGLHVLRVVAYLYVVHVATAVLLDGHCLNNKNIFFLLKI